MDLHERTGEIVFHSCQAQRALEPSDHGRSWHPTPEHLGGSPLRSECWPRPVQAGTIRPILPMRDPRPARPDAVNGPMKIGSTSQHSQAHYVQVARSQIHRIGQAHERGFSPVHRRLRSMWRSILAWGEPGNPESVEKYTSIDPSTERPRPFRRLSAHFRRSLLLPRTALMSWPFLPNASIPLPLL